jgi:hypothetical protein
MKDQPTYQAGWIKGHTTLGATLAFFATVVCAITFSFTSKEVLLALIEKL